MAHDLLLGITYHSSRSNIARNLLQNVLKVLTQRNQLGATITKVVALPDIEI